MSQQDSVKQQLIHILQQYALDLDCTEYLYRPDVQRDTVAKLQQLMVEAEIEKLRILSSLADMYGQYCDGPYGHDFMSAGEGAIEILEDYGLARENKGVDYKAVDKLEAKITQLTQSANGGEEK